MKNYGIELYYDLGMATDTPNEKVIISDVVGNLCWFTASGIDYTCKLIRKGTRMQKNSLRKA